MFEMFQSVKTVVPVPQLGLASGAKGAIVDIYTSPYPAYEVEFFDNEDNTVGFLSMRPEELVSDTFSDSTYKLAA
ncbi:MAG: DUF4926 domain-containing protein [Rhodoferax sp.]|nr:DUF4926 domain-containing protein [Rhodoferax sp.]